jgi:serine protease
MQSHGAGNGMMRHRVGTGLRRSVRWLAALACLASFAGCGGGSGTPTYVVTTTATAGGNVSPASVVVARGGTAALIVSPEVGWLIASVTGCGGTLVNNTFTTGPINAHCTVTATFVRQRHLVTASAEPGGTISPQSIEVEHGSTASFLITPEEGRVIDGIDGCNGSLEGLTYTTAPVTAPCQVSVAFRNPNLSGTIIPAGGTAVDSDVNDPLAPFRTNDNFLQAQPIPNPVTLGGYVNVAGAGPEGRSFATGDPVDIFRVGLLAGQTITLRIASDDVADDLDLYLYDEDENIVDASVDDVSRVESVVVPPDGAGDYFVLVHALSGASNYLLSIGSAFEENPATMRLSDDFIPGEAVVLPASRDGADGFFLQGMGAGRVQESEPRNLLIDLAEFRSAQPQTAAVVQAERIWRELAGPDGQLRTRDPLTADKLATLWLIKGLAHDPALAHAAPNYWHELHATFTPNDPRYPLQWHYPQISLPQAWPLSTGADVVVAVIDSGVHLAHPDLEGRLVPGYDFVLGIPGGNDPGDDPVPPGGSGYHGTHVTGTVVAATNNNLGVAGVAFNASVMPLRACGTTGCPGFAIEQSLRFAAGLPNDSGTVPANPAQVINLSLGRGGPALASEQALYDELRARNIVVVSSAGNNDDSTPGYPAAYRNVFAVSAVDIQRRKAFYSSFGSWIDVAAPGGDLRRDLNADGFPDGVLSTVVDDRDGGATPAYRFFQGTSMASPHVAGVVALMRSAVPALTAQDIENLLRNGAITDDLGPPGHDEVFGHGLINAYKAVVEALNAGGVPVIPAPFMVASPPVANFGTTFQSLTIVFENAGGGTLEFGTPTEDSEGWLEIAAVESNDELVVTLSVRRQGLGGGIYTAMLTVPSNANTVGVPVIMQVAPVMEANVGQQYVLLVEPETFQVVRGVRADIAQDGRQHFWFEDVQPGTYLLFTGSDADNDDFVCDAGESCGVYRSPGDPVLVVVGGSDLEGLDFSSGYDLANPSAAATLETGEGLGLRKPGPVPGRGLPRSAD